MPPILLMAGGLAALLLLILAVFVLFKVAQGIFRIFGLLIAIVITAFLILGFIAFLDLADLRENFHKSEKLLVLEENGNAKAVAVMKENNIEFLDNSSSYTGLLERKDYDALLGGYYKVIILNSYSLNFTETGLPDLFTEYKKGNVIIYPETIAFKMIKMIPLPASFEVPSLNMSEIYPQSMTDGVSQQVPDAGKSLSMLKNHQDVLNRTSMQPICM